MPAQAGERGARRLHDVPGPHRGVGVVEVAVVTQVLPGVAGGSEVATRHLRELRLRGDHARDRVVVGQQAVTAGRAAVVVAVVAGRRVDQRVEAERAAGARVEADVGEHRAAVGVRDPRLRQPPAGRLSRLAKGERARHRVDPRPDAGVAFAVEEGAAVGDRELEVAQARRAEVRVVDLAQRVLAKGEPHVAAALRCGAEAVLVGGSPRVRDAGGARCLRRGRAGAGHAQRHAQPEHHSRRRDSSPPSTRLRHRIRPPVGHRRTYPRPVGANAALGQPPARAARV